MAYAHNGGMRIHYRVIGDGPPLVLYHGFGLTLKAWYLFGYVETLRKRYRVILIDSRGHGASDKPHDPEQYSFDFDVADTLAVLDQLEIDRAALWGYSSGGRVALQLAHSAPARASAIIVGGQDAAARRVPPHFNIDPENPEASLARIYDIANVSEEGISLLKRQPILTNDFHALAAAGQHGYSSLEHVLPAMPMPCLFYAGELDPSYRDIVRYRSSVTVVGLPGLTHTTGFVESPRILETVLPFLSHAYG